jgi:MoaA/NifB/PqqE/SkfB family radical SAM enzyme
MAIHRWLDFKVTRRCNNFGHKCIYCDVNIDPVGAREIISLENIHRTILDARALGFDTFWLLGGEPSLREDASEMFAPLSTDSSVEVTVVTNGKLRNDLMYRSLFDTSARRACIQVSMDSFAPSNMKHANPTDMLRLITDLRDMADGMSSPTHQCDAEVHCVISRENRTNFDEFARFWASKRVPVSLAMVCPWSIAITPVRFNEFTTEEMLDIAHRIDLLETGLPIDRFNPIVANFIRRNLSVRSENIIRRCGAGLTHLVINGDGSVFRCMADSFKPEVSIGNILYTRLFKVLEKSDHLKSCKECPTCFDGYAWDELALRDFKS